MFAYLCCVFSLTPPCALNSLTIHAPPMKNDIIGICYTIYAFSNAPEKGSTSII